MPNIELWGVARRSLPLDADLGHTLPPGGKAAAWLCGLTTLRPGNPYEGEQSWFRYLTSEVQQVFRRFHQPVATEAGRYLLVGIFRKKVGSYG